MTVISQKLQDILRNYDSCKSQSLWVSVFGNNYAGDSDEQSFGVNQL